MWGPSIEIAARRLRWVIGLFWGVLVLAYAAGRVGLAGGPLRIQAHALSETPSAMFLAADVSVVVLTVALLQLNRMLKAIAEGDFFSARVIGGFRSFAFWLLVLALLWIAFPIAAELLRGPGDAHQWEFRLQLRDILTAGVALILFLVARLLERARELEAEMREIV